MKYLTITIFYLIIAVNSTFAFEFTTLTHSSKKQLKRVNGIYYGIEHAGKRAFYVEVVKALLDKLGYPVKITDTPFARGLLRVQGEEDIVFFAVQRTESRENTVKWVGPISQGKDYFYEWKSRPTGIKKLEDAKNLAVCVLNKSVHDAYLSKIGFTRLRRNVKYTTCFKMLELGRVDLAITSLGPIQDKLKDTKISADQIQQTPVLVLAGEIYIAISKNVSDQEIEKWNSALEEIKLSGKYQDLHKQYFP